MKELSNTLQSGERVAIEIVNSSGAIVALEATLGAYTHTHAEVIIGDDSFIVEIGLLRRSALVVEVAA